MLIEGEKLYLYLVVSEEAVSVTLVREKEKVQWLVYYVSKRFRRIKKIKAILSRTPDRGLNQLPTASSATKVER